MATATVTSKGQITIPVSVRHALSLDAGTRVDFVEFVKGQFTIVPSTERVESLKGMLRKPKQAVSIENMNDTIAKRGALAR